MTDRRTLLLSMFDESGEGLEISPSYNPILPKASGYRVETIDYVNAAQLRHKYKDDKNVDITKIEEVDYVSDGGAIATVIGKPNHYDYILASHVIEHIPDLLGFLKQCGTLLKANGVLVLVIPDKRYCFDVLQTLTGTGAILEAHLEKRNRHTPGQLFDFIAYRAIRGNAIIWSEGCAETLSFEYDLNQAKALFDAAQTATVYHDIHAWRFTPSSFRLIIRDLNEIGTLDLREARFHDTIGCEFYVVLSKNGSGCPIDRLSLAESTVREQKMVEVPASAT